MATGVQEIKPNQTIRTKLLKECWFDEAELIEVSELLHEACDAQHGAILSEPTDREADLDPILTYVGLLHVLVKLARAFRQNPEESLSIIARSMGLTRNGLYFRLEMVGLDPDDLRAGKRIPVLMQLSAKMRDHHKAIQPFVDFQRRSQKTKLRPR